MGWQTLRQTKRNPAEPCENSTGSLLGRRSQKRSPQDCSANGKVAPWVQRERAARSRPKSHLSRPPSHQATRGYRDSGRNYASAITYRLAFGSLAIDR